MNRPLLKENTLQGLLLWSEKKARIVTGISGTKITLGCIRAKIIAIVQKRN